jgi:elongator complex protein 6
LKGLDITSLLKARKIIYVDGLGAGYTAGVGVGGSSTTGSQNPPIIPMKGLEVSHISEAITLALKLLSPASTTPTPATTTTSLRTQAHTTTDSTSNQKSSQPIILLDGIDFILASQPSAAPQSLQSFLASLRTKCHALVVTSSADAPLLHNREGSSGSSSTSMPTPLESNHAHFVASMAHLSSRVIQLRALDTGSARDVSGVVRLSKGGSASAADEDEDDGNDNGGDGMVGLSDGEWLYQVKGDGSVRVWGRGA